MLAHDRSHATDFLFYRDIFGSPAARAIWSDVGHVERWLVAEAALANAEATVGLIPPEAGAAVAAACRIENIDFERLSKATELVGYPILPLVRQIEAACAEAGRGYTHWGATTQDIMDTGTALQVRDTRRLLQGDLEKILGRLEALAAEHRDTVMAGRTHGQQALPITLGYKLAVYVVELRRHLERLAAAGARAELVEFAGAAGTLASVGERGLEVQRLMAEGLGLGVAPIAWHTSRDGLAELVSVLGLISATLAKLAQEVALLQRTEIAELEEGYVPGRGGSSTMPQKRNPIASEAIIGAARQLRQLVPAMLDAMLHDNERATGPWHGEWLALPEACVLAHGIVLRTQEVLDALMIRPDRMRANLDISAGLINSEAVMMALAPMIGRQEAHDVVYDASMRAIEHGRPLRQELLAEPSVAQHLSGEEIERLLAPESYVGLAGVFVDRVLGSASVPDPDRRTAGPA